MQYVLFFSQILWVFISDNKEKISFLSTFSHVFLKALKVKQNCESKFTRTTYKNAIASLTLHSMVKLNASYFVVLALQKCNIYSLI